MAWPQSKGMQLCTACIWRFRQTLTKKERKKKRSKMIMVIQKRRKKDNDTKSANRIIKYIFLSLSQTWILYIETPRRFQMLLLRPFAVESSVMIGFVMKSNWHPQAKRNGHAIASVHLDLSCSFSSFFLSDVFFLFFLFFLLLFYTKGKKRARLDLSYYFFFLFCTKGKKVKQHTYDES